MTAPRESARPARNSQLRRNWRMILRRSLPPQTRMVVLLALCTVAFTALILARPMIFPLTMLMIPLLLGSLLLGPRQLPWFVVFVLVMLMLSLTNQPELPPRTVMAVTIFFILGFIILLTSFRRSRLGVAGVLGDSMLVYLRDRILWQCGMPVLPDGWYA